jgi:3D (Asp-Asp-Asp) domain-containing protein
LMPLILAMALVTVTVSGYVPSICPSVNCWGDGSITAMGLTPGPSIAACGDAWPAFAVLWIPTYGAVICGDRGGGLAPYQVDVWFPTLDAAVRWGGRKSLQVQRLL